MRYRASSRMRAADLAHRIGCRSLRELVRLNRFPPAKAGGFMLSLAYAS